MRFSQIKQNNWFKIFFDKYYQLLYFKGGIFSSVLDEREVDFIIKVLDLPKKSKILDVPCGQGRHTVRLAKKGYSVTGVDLSKALLDLAKKTAVKGKIDPCLVRGDMRKIKFHNEFDAAINMFSSFGYFSNEKDNIDVLKNMHQSLKHGGKLLLDLLNKDKFLERLLISKRGWWEEAGNYILEDNSFDKKKKAWVNHVTILSPSGRIGHAYTFMRLYDLSEIEKYLNKIGFKILEIYGDYRGNKFSHSSPRMIILAQKVK